MPVSTLPEIARALNHTMTHTYRLSLIFTAAIVALWALPLRQLPAGSPAATLGAYYFEGWYHDTPQAVAAFANAELRNNFPEREPIWGGGLWRGDTVEVMEQQIDLAADHGIAFFSFDWYWYGSPAATVNDGINSGLKNFMLAANRDRMQFNINIVDAGPTTIDSDAQWRQVADLLLPYMADSQYLRVGGNPLVTNFAAGGMTQTNYQDFQQRAATAGLGEIEFAANVAGPASLYTHVTRYNAVPGWGAGETEYPYQSITEYVEGNDSWAPGIWNTESGGSQSYIPTVMAGWDARPWNIPPSWYFNPSRTPGAVAAHLQKAIDWIDNNPALATPERLVMLYAWNEFGEGGYIAPTIGDPDGLYLDAIQSVIGGGGVSGDYNENGTVDAADYTVWRDSLGQTGSNLPADGTGDGYVYRVDYTYWKTRFGSGSAGSGSAGNGTAVPEPPGQALAWMAILLGMIFGRDWRPGDGAFRRPRCTSRLKTTVVFSGRFLPRAKHVAAWRAP